MMWSAPGVGKTSIVEAITERHGIQFIDFRLGQCEPQDVGGIRIPDLETGRLKRYIPTEYPDPNRKDYCPQGIIFLDELTTADKALQSAALGLTNERHLGRETYVVPDGYGIFAAGNPKGVGAHSLTMASPLANRMMHLEIEADPASLVKFFRERGGPADRELAKIPRAERRAAFLNNTKAFRLESTEVHPDVIGFLDAHPVAANDMARGNPERGYPSSRSWERVSTMIKLAEKGAFDVKQTDVIVQGLVGPGVSTEFAAFRSMSAGLPNSYKLLTDPGAAKAFIAPTKSDEKYALTSNLIFQMFRKDGDAELDKRMVDNFMTVAGKLEKSFASILVQEVFSKAGAQKERTANNTSPRQGLMIQPKYMAVMAPLFAAHTADGGDPKKLLGAAPVAPTI